MTLQKLLLIVPEHQFCSILLDSNCCSLMGDSQSIIEYFDSLVLNRSVVRIDATNNTLFVELGEATK